MQVILDSLLADKELFANFLVAVALGDKLNNFLFSIAEQRFLAARPAIGRLRESFHDFRGHVIVEPDFPAMDLVNAPDQEIRGRLLQDHASRTQSHPTYNYPARFDRRRTRPRA